MTMQWRIQDFQRDGQQLPRRMCKLIILQIFYQKLYENERILSLGGGGVALFPGAPIGSTTAMGALCVFFSGN